MPPFLVNKAASAIVPASIIRPIRAGTSILNPASGTRGTIGLLLTSDGFDRWLLSCYHVVCRPYRLGQVVPFGFGEAVFQPDAAAAIAPVAILAPGLIRPLPERMLDAAAVRIDGERTVDEILGLDGIIRVNGVIPPQLGMPVIKSGAMTGVTHGIVSSVLQFPAGLRVEVDFDPNEADQSFVAPGDSGAVWIDRITGAAVAMHNGETSSGASTGTALVTLLPQLGLGTP